MEDCVISMFEHSADLIAKPIFKRILAGPQMLLRATEDIDLLVHALVDGIVDESASVIECYQEQLVRFVVASSTWYANVIQAELEREVLYSPKREHTRELHLFVSDCSLLKRTLAPVITIVNDFRANLQNLLVSRAVASSVPDSARGSDNTESSSVRKIAKQSTSSRSGYWVSIQSILLTCANPTLADVSDHIQSNSDSLDSMGSLAEGLISMIFNTLSSRQNDIMEALTITTIVFLPLT